MTLRRAAAGLLLEVRPLPMAGALFTALLGFAWAQGGLRSLGPAQVALLGCVFFGLYTAHLNDTRIDLFERGDRTEVDLPLVFRDSSGFLDERSYPPLIAAACAACALLGAPAAAQGGPPVAVLLAGALALALTYSAALDKTFVGVSFGYPLGVAAVFAAAYLTAHGPVDLRLALILIPLVIALIGTKVRSDAIDRADDGAIGKRTLPVLLGARLAVPTGYALALLGLGLWAALPLLTPLTPLFSVPPLLAAVAVCMSARKGAVKGSLQMAYALVAMLALEVAVLAVG
jgi:1,4-dihydroxy-2-naphthoate octaprenyltransferase